MNEKSHSAIKTVLGRLLHSNQKETEKVVLALANGEEDISVTLDGKRYKVSKTPPINNK